MGSEKEGEKVEKLLDLNDPPKMVHRSTYISRIWYENQGKEMIFVVTEKDNYKMPPLFTGEYTPEILEKKRRLQKKADEDLKKIKKVYEQRKTALV